VSADGTPAVRSVVNTSVLSFSGSFSADGRTLYYRRTDPKLGLDIFSVGLDDTANVQRPVVQTRFNESAPAVSPNGPLLAYVSDESGRSEIYVRRIDSLGTIAKGKIADLVLLNADPIADIKNTTRINSVVFDGRLIDYVDRQQMLDQVRLRVALPIPEQRRP
jgi:hypothetical protein